MVGKQHLSRVDRIMAIISRERGKRAQGRVNGATRSGRLFRGWFTTMAPGPLAVRPRDVQDLEVLEPIESNDDSLCPVCGFKFPASAYRAAHENILLETPCKKCDTMVYTKQGLWFVTTCEHCNEPKPNPLGLCAECGKFATKKEQRS